MIYLYFISLLLIIFLSFYTFYLRNNCPKTIKSIVTIVTVMIILRMVTLMLTFVKKSISYMGYFKYTYYLNFIYIPIIISIVFFILWRNSKLKSSSLVIVLIISICAYLIILLLNKPIVEIFTDYKMGYVINFNVPITEFYYGFINIIAFAFIMKFLLNAKDINGVLIVVAASLLSLAEIALILGFGAYMPQPLMGEAIWVVALERCVESFKENTRVYKNKN